MEVPGQLEVGPVQLELFPEAREVGLEVLVIRLDEHEVALLLEVGPEVAAVEE